MATLLYEELVVKCGVILMSDNKQYEAGKALWQKIAQESDKLAVFILDSDVGQFTLIVVIAFPIMVKAFLKKNLEPASRYHQMGRGFGR